MFPSERCPSRSQQKSSVVESRVEIAKRRNRGRLLSVYEKRSIEVLLLGSPRSRNHPKTSRIKSRSASQALIPRRFSSPYFLPPNQPENQPPPVLPPEAEEEAAPPADDFPLAFFFSGGGLKTLRISTMRRSKTCSAARRFEHIISVSELGHESGRERIDQRRGLSCHSRTFLLSLAEVSMKLAPSF